jgi:mono/diheme cytochrome c family protein
MNFWLRIGGIFSLLAALFGSAHAVDFETEVLPIFKTHCFECHGPETQKSGFRLDLRSAAMTGGTEGVAILPNKPDESPLIQYIGLPKGDDLRMPPKGAGLAAAEILKLREWVASGRIRRPVRIRVWRIGRGNRFVLKPRRRSTSITSFPQR